MTSLEQKLLESLDIEDLDEDDREDLRRSARYIISTRERASELLASARGQVERFMAERDFQERRALRAERELAELRDRR
jgi:hypothetical protein